MTDKQEQFCQEYVVDFCQTKAAIRAGYSAKSAREQAHQLMQQDDIRERINTLRIDKINRTQMRADRVTEEFIAIAFADLSDFLEWGPDGFRLKHSSELTPEQSCVVLEVSETVSKFGTTRSIKLHPKIRALEALAKMFDLTPETLRVKHSGAVRFVQPTVKQKPEAPDASE